MIKLDIREDTFVKYESGGYYGIVKNVRIADEGYTCDILFDLLMLHNGETHTAVQDNSKMAAELEIVEKIDVQTELIRDKGNAYEEIAKYYKQIAIITNIEHMVQQVPEND